MNTIIVLLKMITTCFQLHKYKKIKKVKINGVEWNKQDTGGLSG